MTNVKAVILSSSYMIRPTSLEESSSKELSEVVNPWIFILTVILLSIS